MFLLPIRDLGSSISTPTCWPGNTRSWKIIFIDWIIMETTACTWTGQLADDVFQCLSLCCIPLRRRCCEWHLTDWHESAENQLKTHFKPPPNVGLDLFCKIHVLFCSADLNKIYYINNLCFYIEFHSHKKGIYYYYYLFGLVPRLEILSLTGDRQY